ncbi:MAG: DUF4175 family protein [Rhodobacteraceae bacterium]|nr:DUF4175 family protein [Paracoccaceae bacterium]
MTPYGARFQAKKRDPLKGLSRQIGLAKLSLAAESALRAFWPFLSLALTAYGGIALGGLAVLPILGVQVLVVVIAFALVWLLISGIRQFKFPSTDDALAHLDAGMENSPIAALRDEPALTSNDPITAGLWQVHQDRMEAAALKARATAPQPELAKRDPIGLRLMALIVAIIALGFAPRPDLTTLAATVSGNDKILTAPSVAIEAWATPPAYTGKPALYLTEIAEGETLDLPVGTVITVRFYGDGNFALTEQVSGDNTVIPAPEPDVPVRDVQFAVVVSGDITLKNGSDVLGRWVVNMIADAPPTLSVPDGLEKSAEGAMELTYTATDDYGIDTARITIRPDLTLVERRFGLAANPIIPDAFERDLPMPFSQDRTDIKETFIEDFSEHLWAHLPVVITLEVTDGAGQTASLTLDPDDLPARTFFDLLAAGIVEQRRDLLWSPDNDIRVSQVLRAISFQPEDGFFPSSSSYLLTRTTIRRMGYQMEDGLDDSERAEIAELLWLIAVSIEDGDLSGAAARLRRAQERLAQGLENGATDEELAELMDELRDATQDYLRQLAQDAQPGDGPQQGQPSQSITADQLQEMMDKIQELAENGQREEARQMLEQLNDLMNNMQMTQQQGQQGQPGQEQQNLQDSLQQQQQLSDEAFQQLQNQLDQNQQGQSGEELAERQDALRRYLEELRRQSGSEEGAEALAEAERNMARARDRLNEGDFSGALDEQARVMESLRQGLRELRNRNQAEETGEDGQVDPNSAQRDPLGRPVGSQGRIDNGDTKVPDQNAADRARELLEEIRRRSGDAERPVEELDYLKRLLERF